MIRSIYADYFFFGVFVDHVEVHLPTERGITQYVEMLNFDSMSVRDYRAARVQWGWSVSFNISDGNTLYHADFAVSTATGETVLTLLTPDLRCATSLAVEQAGERPAVSQDGLENEG